MCACSAGAVGSFSNKPLSPKSAFCPGPRRPPGAARARAPRARPTPTRPRMPHQTYGLEPDAVVSHIDRSAGRQSAESPELLSALVWGVAPLPYTYYMYIPYSLLPSLRRFFGVSNTRNATLTRVTAPCVPRRHASRSSSAPESRVALLSESTAPQSTPAIAQARRGVSIEPLRRPPPSASACTLTASPCCEPSGAGWPVGRVECRGPGRGLGWPRGRPAG